MRVLFLLSLIALFSSGCVMTDPQMQNEAQMRTNSAIQRLATRVERLEQRNEAIETRSESTSEELRQLRAMLESEARRAEVRLAAMEKDVAATAVAREKLRKELAADLGKRIGVIMAKQAADSVPPASGGYEHTVKSGETLSEIARAYGVTSSVIVRDNKLRDANSLRVGQKLFIRE